MLRFEKNGSLFDFIQRSGKIPLDYAQKTTTKIVLGLHLLHIHNIIHGDLKPENILLDTNLRAHVADFGLAVTIKPNTLLYCKWGSEAYQAPEQLSKNSDVPWDHRIDIFNVGVILLQIMLTGRHPFGKEDCQIQANCRKIAFHMPPLNDPNAVSFIKKTLCQQDDRLNVISIQKHPFIDSIAPFYDGINFFPYVFGMPLEVEELVPLNVRYFTSL